MFRWFTLLYVVSPSTGAPGKTRKRVHLAYDKGNGAPSRERVGRERTDRVRIRPLPGTVIRDVSSRPDGRRPEQG